MLCSNAIRYGAMAKRKWVGSIRTGLRSGESGE